VISRASAADAPPAALLPVPDLPAQRKSEKLVRQLFAEITPSAPWLIIANWPQGC